MTHTAFFDVVHQTAHASMSGTMQPALGGKLLTHLKIIAKFFAGDQIVTVDEGTAEFLILPKISASGTASLIDQTAELVGEGDSAQYEFEWNPAWTEQLRDALDTAADLTAPMEFRYELHFKRGGVFGAIGGPIYFLNNFFRPDTLPPSSVSEANYAWLKRSVLAGTNVTRVDDDVARTITINGEDSEANAAAIAAETDARIAADAALQSAVDGKAPASHTHPISEVTNLQSSLDAKLNADDESVTNPRTPTGGAGGVLSGSYPNPGFAVDMATQGELDAVSAQLPAKADLVDGKIPTSQIPAIAISEFLGAVASQAAMLALTGQKGDWCNRSDTSTAWVIIGDDPSQLESWGQINYPAPIVTSVNGQTGVIVLGKSDIGLGSVDNTSDANKPVSTAQQAALNGKANSSHTHGQGEVTGLTAALASKATLSQVVRTDQTAYTGTPTFAENHGSLVSIPVRLKSPDSSLADNEVFILPRLPRFFVVRGIWLMFDGLINTSLGTGQVDWILHKQDLNENVPVLSGSHVAAGDRCNLLTPILVGELLLAPNVIYSFEVETITQPYLQQFYGGVLWLLGYYQPGTF